MSDRQQSSITRLLAIVAILIILMLLCTVISRALKPLESNPKQTTEQEQGKTNKQNPVPATPEGTVVSVAPPKAETRPEDPEVAANNSPEAPEANPTAPPGKPGAAQTFQDDIQGEAGEYSALYRELSPADRDLAFDYVNWQKASDEQKSVLTKIIVSKYLKESFTWVKIQSHTIQDIVYSTALIRHASSGIEFCFIPGGVYTMGSSLEKGGTHTELPRHRVRISPFLLATTELTIAQWRKLGGAIPADFYKTKDPKALAKAKSYEPVLAMSKITRADARAVLERFGSALRLPSEAEWEFACRAGTTTKYYFGDDWKQLKLFGYFHLGSPRYRKVKAKAPNRFGLYDMHGNHAELCEDDYFEDYKGNKPDTNAPRRRTTPATADGKIHGVARGGPFWLPPGFLTSSARLLVKQGATDKAIGLRVARSLP